MNSMKVSSFGNGLATFARRGVALTQHRHTKFTVALAVTNLLATHAFAAGGDTDPSTILQNVLTIITGSMGTALAALGIIACGLMWMFGRASLGVITGVVGGIMIVFGASYIANQLVGAG